MAGQSPAFGGCRQAQVACEERREIERIAHAHAVQRGANVNPRPLGECGKPRNGDEAAAAPPAERRRSGSIALQFNGAVEVRNTEGKIAITQAQPFDVEPAVNERLRGAAGHVERQARKAGRLELAVIQIEQLRVRAPVRREVERRRLAKFDRPRDFERRGRAEHLEPSDREFRIRKARVEGLGIRPGKVGHMNRELLHVALGLDLAEPRERPPGAERSADGNLRVEAAIEE